MKLYKPGALDIGSILSVIQSIQLVSREESLCWREDARDDEDDITPRDSEAIEVQRALLYF